MPPAGLCHGPELQPDLGQPHPPGSVPPGWGHYGWGYQSCIEPCCRGGHSAAVISPASTSDAQLSHCRPVVMVPAPSLPHPCPIPAPASPQMCLEGKTEAVVLLQARHPGGFIVWGRAVGSADLGGLWCPEVSAYAALGRKAEQ